MDQDSAKEYRKVSETLKKWYSMMDQKDGDQLEVELELGILNSNWFEPGISYNHFAQIVKAMAGSKSESNLSKRFEQKMHNVRMIRSLYRDNRRHTVYVNLNNRPSEVIQKVPIQKVDIKILNMPCDIRLKLAREVPLQRESVCKDRPKGTRLIQRWSMVYDGAYRYDLSKTAYGRNTADARSQKPRFEVELELTKKPKDDPLLLLERGFDLVGRYRSDGSKIIPKFRVAPPINR